MAGSASRNPSSDLESVVGKWTGPSVFTDIIPSSSSASSSTSVLCDSTNIPEPNNRQAADPASFTTPDRAAASGSVNSPISIKSTPSPLTRPRGKPDYASPIAKAAYDVPRPTRPILQSSKPSPPRFTMTKSTVKPIHPFFGTAYRRAKSAVPIPRAPPTNRPRLVAHFSSTSASASGSGLSSQSTQASQPRPQTSSIKGKGRAYDPNVWVVDGVEIELTSLIIGSDRGSGKEESDDEEIYEERVTESEIRNLSEMLAEMELPASAPVIKANPVIPIPRTLHARRITRKSKPKVVVPTGLPLYDHTTFTPRPKVAYTSDVNEANDLLSCLKGDVLGFDMEWPTAGQRAPNGTVLGRFWDDEEKKYRFTVPRTALLQFCDDELIVMVHIWHMDRIPEKVVEILQDPKIFKTGVAIRNDGNKLLRDYPEAFPQGIASLLELSLLARRADPLNTGPGRTLIGLAKLVASYLHRHLDKDQDVRGSNWMLPLTRERATYAANDVHAGMHLYHAFRRLAKQNDVPVDLDYIATHLPGRAGAAPKAKTVTGGKSSKPRDPSTPSPAKMKAVEMYKTGLSTTLVAQKRGVQTETIQ
ncbi:ribonuclease H-like domain-containing protein [Kockovaella imperatae]|uniref:Ribonuclease H-like domain-containing protein n=1 Tax=Kockovaella imperatae TaxID=4999 RepID=A0A1Y1U757_9TREE|nr:ribonuclease H-like domain-containing protein [Kockovaella imperatae]ORX33838.1 ribonuclease H-like domain-containing protein [Kockovaella imperatae]